MHNAGDIPLTEWRFALRKILLSSSGVRGIPAWSFFLRGGGEMERMPLLSIGDLDRVVLLHGAAEWHMA